LTSKKHEFEHDVMLDVETRVRQGVKAVLEEVLQEEMTQHLQAGYRELTPTRRGERNGHYQRNLLTPAGKIERLEVPRDREGEFVTELFERYKRMTGDVEEAVLEMYLSGISVRKIAGVTDALSKVRVGKDAVSRIAARLEAQQKEWRGRSLEGKTYPYLYLDATYLKVRWGASVTSMALLACVGVDEEGFREVFIGGGGSRLGEGRGVHLFATRAAGPRTARGASSSLRRPRGHQGSRGRRVTGGPMAAVRGALPAQRLGPCTSFSDDRGGRGP